jgi:hypothetical protein
MPIGLVSVCEGNVAALEAEEVTSHNPSCIHRLNTFPDQ